MISIFSSYQLVGMSYLILFIIFFWFCLKNSKIFFIFSIGNRNSVVFILNKFGKDLRSFNNFSSIDINTILKTEYLLTFILLFYYCLLSIEQLTILKIENKLMCGIFGIHLKKN